MKKKVYVAGPMTGYPDFNFPAFDAAASRLRDMGLEVINPADIDRENGTDPTKGEPVDLKKIIKNDVNAVQTCDMMFLLPGWRRSVGARAEIALAHWMGIPVFEQFTDHYWFTQKGLVRQVLPFMIGMDYQYEMKEAKDYGLRPEEARRSKESTAPSVVALSQ